MNQSFVKIRCVIEVLNGPLMLLTSHAVRLNYLSELLSEGAEVVGKNTDTHDHHNVGDD